MNSKYSQQEFAEKLTLKLKNGRIPECPYCGSTSFRTTEDYASILVSDDFDGLKIGNSIPCGIVICEKCGHIELFALGALQLLPNKEKNKND